MFYYERLLQIRCSQDRSRDPGSSLRRINFCRVRGKWHTDASAECKAAVNCKETSGQLCIPRSYPEPATRASTCRGGSSSSKHSRTTPAAMAADAPTGWVNILADDFTATVSTRTLLAQADSHLAQVSEHCDMRCAEPATVPTSSALPFLRFFGCFS
jgi:hypothetical protein